MTFYQSASASGAEDPLLQALRWRTVYDSANAATRANRLKRAVRRNGDLLSNSGSLLATSVLTSVVGFGYWWVAARLFRPEAVGSVSAAVSAMTLVGTLGMFGMGTLLLSELPRIGRSAAEPGSGEASTGGMDLRAGQWRLISACVLTAAAVAGLGGIIYELLAWFLNPGLRAALGSPLSAVLLLAGMALNAAILVLDEGLVGLLRGRLQLLRNAYFAFGKLILLCLLPVLPLVVTGTAILATWIGGNLVSLALLSVSLRHKGFGGPLRPDFSLLRGLRRNALDHNLLNLALFLPRTMLPLVVTAVLSTRATAAFYTAWMVLSFLAMIPGNVATTLLAVTSADRTVLRGKMRIALLVSLGIGLPASLLVAVLARPVMVTFGESYAAMAAPALSILALTFAATVIRQLFVAVSRVQGRIRRATGFAVGVGLVELVAAWYGAGHGGLTTMALYLAVVFAAEGVLMAPAVLRAAFAPASGAASPDTPPALDAAPALVAPSVRGRRGRHAAGRA
jgi:O-antigen/teichoic acid export membrane protein